MTRYGGDLAEEPFRHVEAPETLEGVQQPVGVGRIAARLELPEPHEPRHADVDRLLEQMLEVAPQSGRHPLGDAGFDPAFRVDERIGAEPLDRRRWPAGWSACATAPGVLLRKAARRAHALVPGLGPHRVVAELLRELGISPVTLYRYVVPQDELRQQGQKVLAS